MPGKHWWIHTDGRRSKNPDECILSNEIMWNANLMQLGNFIGVFLARHVSGTYAHHQEH